MDYAPWYVNRSILYQFNLSLVFGMLFLCYCFKLTRYKVVIFGLGELMHFVIVAFVVIIFLISPWMYLEVGQNPFIWYFTILIICRVFIFLQEKDRVFWVTYMGVMVIFGVSVANLFQKSEKKLFLNLKRKVVDHLN